MAFGKKESVFKANASKGLADARPLEAYVKQQYNVCEHMAFKDHHAYTSKDIEWMARQAAKYQAQRILVTEKDYVKLMHPSFSEIIDSLPFWYLPIEVCFLFGEQQAFIEKVLNSLTEPPQ